MDENKTYDEGYSTGCAAALSRGGTKGAEWYADARNLTGNLREVFIGAFNEGLDSVEPEKGADADQEDD
jgi:hypothetical protein